MLIAQSQIDFLRRARSAMRRQCKPSSDRVLSALAESPAGTSTLHETRSTSKTGNTYVRSALGMTAMPLYWTNDG